MINNVFLFPMAKNYTPSSTTSPMCSIRLCISAVQSWPSMISFGRCGNFLLRHWRRTWTHIAPTPVKHRNSVQNYVSRPLFRLLYDDGVYPPLHVRGCYQRYQSMDRWHSCGDRYDWILESDHCLAEGSLIPLFFWNASLARAYSC